jgi:S-DNA-T family DNA segregation ATPase FtsK/SpoIIIE
VAAVPTEAVHGATVEEAVILDRIAQWDDLARERGLDGLAPHAPLLDSSGICVGVSLGGKWTPDRVRGSAGRIRAMLAVPEGTGVQVTPGATGDQVVLRIRTRTPELDTRWYPGRPGIGVVPETGRVVDLDAYGHRLVAGTTGAGKSVAMRPWMASVVLNPLAALVFCDPKGQEERLWAHCARTVKGVGGAGRDRMYRVISEVADELEWRQENAQGTDWIPSADHPELVLVVDEGAAIVRMAKLKPYRDVLDKLDYIASQGRAGRVWLHWATQYPTKTEGVPVQVTENMTKGRLALRVDSPTADRVVFGENATATGWTPSELDMPGWAMLRTENPRDVPEHIRLLYMTDEQVRALPARDPWHCPGTPDQDAEEAAEEMPEVLAAALEQMGPDAHGVRGHEIADVLGWDLVDVQAEMVDLGVRGGRFSERGVQVRGYRREDITAAAAKYRA